MTISLNVLNHLGINLYSNVPAVLSEVVANAWDADAHEVTIDIDKEQDQIIIKDDGIGMTEEDINRRYLNVGYRRRIELPGAYISLWIFSSIASAYLKRRLINVSATSPTSSYRFPATADNSTLGSYS